jgi:hypothetical protein
MEREAISRRIREAGRVVLGMIDPFKLSYSTDANLVGGKQE